MNTQHTPGPWNVEPLQWDHGASIAIVSKGDIVAVIPPTNEEDEPDESTARHGLHDAANARLIAVAPEQNSALMLAETALEQASTALERCGDEDTRGLVRSALIETRAAIAKAKGE